MAERRARDLALLDALDAHEGVSFAGDVWRIVREERDVLQGYPSRARWDPGVFDVLYTSMAREGALEEIHFHLSRQPVFPSKVRSVLHRITVQTRRTLKLADLSAVAALGVSPETFSTLDYTRTQEIADAADFLGFDGIIAPSARWPCHNLVFFTDKFGPGDFVVADREPVDWAAWRAQRGTLLKAVGPSAST
jgi:RES domain-containing protein